jgi:hypothetical protein
MAMSACVKCGKNRFEMKSASPIGSDYSFSYLQCAACGGVAGLTESYYNAVTLDRIEKEITALRNDVRSIESNVDAIRRYAQTR